MPGSILPQVANHFFMWTRKTPEEITAGKRIDFLRNFCWLVFGWAVLYFALDRVRASLGATLREPLPRMVLAFAGAALAVVIAEFRARRRLRNTVVCDRCNTVKNEDGDPFCKCGGEFITLLEAQWLNAPAAEPPPGPSSEQKRMLTNAR